MTEFSGKKANEKCSGRLTREDAAPEEPMDTSSVTSAASNSCPNCGGTECWREEVDIGVGIQCGPLGCPECGWSEDDEWNLHSRLIEDSIRRPTRGGLTKKVSP